MDKIVLEKAKIEDLPTIVELHNEQSNESRKFMKGLDKKEKVFFYSKAEIKKLLTSPTCYLVLAKLNNKTVGCGLARIEKASRWSKYKLQGYLGMLYVKPMYRRQGIAWALQEERVRWLKERGIKLLTCTVFVANKESLSLQQKRGFIPHSVHMYKELKQF